MREKLLDKRNPKDEAYAAMVLAQLKEIKREIKPKSTIQSSSMQALIDRDPALDEQMKNRIPDPATYRCEIVERSISVQEFLIIEGGRRKSKNTIGCSQESATTPEKREAAINAFICTPPAELTIDQMHKLTELNRIKEYVDLPPKPKKKSFWDLFTKLFKSELQESKSFYDKLSNEDKARWTIKEKK